MAKSRTRSGNSNGHTIHLYAWFLSIITFQSGWWVIFSSGWNILTNGKSGFPWFYVVSRIQCCVTCSKSWCISRSRITSL